MKHTLEQRLAGTPQAYWVLKIFHEGQELPIVHTGKGSKGYRYLSELLKSRYQKQKYDLRS